MDDPNQGGSVPADDQSQGGIGGGDSGGGYTPPVSEPETPAEETPAETPAAETPSQEPVSTPEPEQGDGNVGGDVGGDQNPAGGTPGM